MGILLFQLGFLPVSFWDVIDILIVTYLLYQLYKLLRGNFAINIIIGVVMLYMVWWLVNQLNMSLLAAVLDQFVSVGVIILIIIFQPEVRRFLLVLGNTALRQRSNFVGRILDRNVGNTAAQDDDLLALKSALLRMARKKTGALIILTHDMNLEGVISSGVTLDAQITEPLIESIFNKESPLHDGAMLIAKNRIHMASCVLPVSESTEIPKSAGLRHRAAVGITERAKVAAFVVSEETGHISFAYEGVLYRKITEARLEELLQLHYSR